MNSTPRKLWKPPSFDDFNVESRNKKIKLDDSVKFAPVEEVDVAVVPEQVSQLAVHSKKIEEVQNWFLTCARNDSRRANVLLVTGPTGSGKTVTVKLVAKSLDFIVREWINPIDKVNFNSEFNENEPFDKNNYREKSQVEKFNEFIFRTSKYRSVFSIGYEKVVVLVKDFPNIFFVKPSLFQQFLMKFKIEGKSPIVFICTEEQSFTYITDLFPNNIRNELNISHIKFNPIAKTFILKVLNNQVKKYNDVYQNANVIDKKVLNEVCQHASGDLRSAVSGLQILATGILKRSKTKLKKHLVNLHSISQRDSTPEFYQLLGRVLHPKRVTDDIKSQKDNDMDTPATENKIFVHNITDIAEQLNEFDNTLVLLQENYIDSTSSITDLSRCSNILSEVDLLDSYTENEIFKVYRNMISSYGLMLSNAKPKKSGFRPIRNSKWSKYTKETKDSYFNKYMKYFEFQVTNRVLHMDTIPYMKFMPQYHNKMTYSDLNRLESIRSYSQKSFSQDSNRSNHNVYTGKLLPAARNEDIFSDVEDKLTIEDDSD